jgi:lipopolysaccharide transport system permease protein
MHANTLNPIKITRAILQHRYLIAQLVRRDLILKYRGSVLGIGWSFLYPLLLLFTFSLVFGGVFGGKWANKSALHGLDLTLFIYCGIIIFTPFSEVITTAPRLLLANQNFVKKIIFPTEILPLVTLLSACAHSMVHIAIVILAGLLTGHAHPSLFLVPLVVIPFWLFTLGIAWFVTAAGAYIRDLTHVMPVLLQLLMFLSPVFYPISASPGILQTIHQFNPLALSMDLLRQVIIEGAFFDVGVWTLMTLSCVAIAIFGYAFYNSCREEFADVL